MLRGRDMSTKQMQTSARLQAACPHFSQLCKLLGIFSPFAVRVGAGIHQQPTQLNTRVWLQSAEHRSKVLLSSESSTFGYVGPPQTKDSCLSLTLRGKKGCLLYPAWVQDQQHLLYPICVHKMQWLRLEATLLVTCVTPAQAGSP